MIIGDAIKEMSRMDNDSFGAVVTSPPYNIGIDYGLDIRDDLSEKEYGEFTVSWVFQALRISKVVVINFGSPTSKASNLARFMLDCEKAGGIIQSHIIWAKSISTKEFSKGHFKPVNSKRFITNLHESIFVVSRDGNYELDRKSIGVPFSDKSNIKRFNSNTSDLRCRGNIWFLPYETRTRKKEHPASYPVELAEMMIKLVNPDSVLDPFIGSGSTKEACENLLIPCEGIDLREWS